MGEVPRFKGDPWRGACPECGSTAIQREHRVYAEEPWRCHRCNAYDIEPVDRKEAARV